MARADGPGGLWHDNNGLMLVARYSLDAGGIRKPAGVAHGACLQSHAPL